MGSTGLTVLVIALVVGAIAFMGGKEGLDSRLFPGLEGMSNFIGGIPGMGLFQKAREGMAGLAGGAFGQDTALDRRRRKKRGIRVGRRVPCDGQEPSADGMYIQNPEGATPAYCSPDKYTNSRGTHPVSAVSGSGARFRQLREISDKRRQGMGVSFNPGPHLKGKKRSASKGKKNSKKREGMASGRSKPLQNQDFLGANVGHVVMPELLPKRLGVQDLRGTPYIKPGMAEFAGGGGMESIITDYDTDYVGLTRM
jgi:hypothetical protein